MNPRPAQDAADTARPAQDPRSQAEVQLEPPERLAEWARQLGVTPEALQAAARAVGPRVDRIKDHLTGGGAGSQSGG